MCPSCGCYILFVKLHFTVTAFPFPLSVCVCVFSSPLRSLRYSSHGNCYLLLLFSKSVFCAQRFVWFCVSTLCTQPSDEFNFPIVPNLNPPPPPPPPSTPDPNCQLNSICKSKSLFLKGGKNKQCFLGGECPRRAMSGA